MYFDLELDWEQQGMQQFAQHDTVMQKQQLYLIDQQAVIHTRNRL